uniref:RING-type domain-containing protein n=1 Tax=Oryza brachyantha TaxID=4533 RepID=J3N384_ORYBR
MESSSCGICHGDMRRRGEAVFTAECDHQFHFSCISGSVARGRIACPLCHTRWREFPSFRGKDAPAPAGASVAQPFFRPVEPRVFDDDEPLVRAPRRLGERKRVGAASVASDGGSPVALATHCEHSAVARDVSREDFAVLVHARAPSGGGAAAAAAEAPRAPLDLVTVLDVSGSMVGNKLVLLKQAMGFVIDNLGPGDRLCVISFSSGSSRLMRLTRMTDGGKAHAKRAVESLSARGGTNIGAALHKAAKVLDERLYRNAVESVILLSDGQDTYTVPARGGYDRDANYDALVPPSFVRPEDGGRSPPVHTFGFGKDHDAAAMHTIAEVTGGTFSFIENEAAIQDGFAQCIGGLLSVAVQELRLDVACVDTGVRVTAIKSGNYKSHIDEDGRAATVHVGELYADEERSFLLFVIVPRAEAWDDATRLVEVSCSYRDMETGRTTSVAGDEEAVVDRPSRAEAGVAERSVEVDRELVRVEAIDDIALARAAAERGAYAEAAEILRSRQRWRTGGSTSCPGAPTCSPG